MPGGHVEGQAPYVVHMRMAEQHCLLVHAALGAAPRVQHKLQLRQDDAGLLQAVKLSCPACIYFVDLQSSMQVQQE
jgi:hypothetical protein